MDLTICTILSIMGLLAVGQHILSLHSQKHRALKHIKNKYNEDLGLVKSNTESSGMWSESYTKTVVELKKLPGYNITVTQKGGTISDNCIGILMKDPIEREFQGILSEIYDTRNFGIFYIPEESILHNTTKVSMTIPEYARLIGKLNLRIFISTKEELDKKDEMLEKLRILIAEKQYRCKYVLDIFYISHDKLPKIIDSYRDPLYDIHTDRTGMILHGLTSIDSNSQFVYTHWKTII